VLVERSEHALFSIQRDLAQREGASEIEQVAILCDITYIDRTEGQTLLLFNNTEGGENFALNLALISRIEKIESRSIQRVGGQEFLKYQDGSLRLIRLQDHLPVSGSQSDPEEQT